MKIKTIRKSIDILASKEKVWDVLMDDKLMRIWYAIFSEGSHAETDWKVGSKVLFVDQNRSGLIAKVIANTPYDIVSVAYLGFMMNGVEDYESEGAKNMIGGLETYRLVEKDGITHLSVESDMGEEYFSSMSVSWQEAVEKIKALAEENK